MFWVLLFFLAKLTSYAHAHTTCVADSINEEPILPPPHTVRSACSIDVDGRKLVPDHFLY